MLTRLSFATQNSRRGLTLVELVIAMVVGAIVLLPITIFMVEMTKASTAATAKTVLAARSTAALLALRIALFRASQIQVRDGAGNAVAQGVVGSEVRFAVGNSNNLDHYLRAAAGNLVYHDGVSETIMVFGIGAFAVFETANHAIDLSFKLFGNDSRTLAVTVHSQFMPYNFPIN